MSKDLTSLAQWAGALLAKLSPAQRRVVSRKVAVDLRRSQAQRIARQRAPDGSNYAARKKPKELRNKTGRIQRQKSAMFNKLRTSKWLKVQSTEHEAHVGFAKQVYYVARVHQYGMQDRIGRKQSRLYSYPARPLLGFSEQDRAMIEESILKHLTSP